jgi:hypothetical protein
MIFAPTNVHLYISLVSSVEAIRKRFKTFVEESLPVKGHYEGEAATML